LKVLEIQKNDQDVVQKSIDESISKLTHVLTINHFKMISFTSFDREFDCCFQFPFAHFFLQLEHLIIIITW
jgi:hypothetical protein